MCCIILTSNSYLCYNIKAMNKGNNAILNKNLHNILLNFYIIAMLCQNTLKFSFNNYVIYYIFFHMTGNSLTQWLQGIRLWVLFALLQHRHLPHLFKRTTTWFFFYNHEKQCKPDTILFTDTHYWARYLSNPPISLFIMWEHMVNLLGKRQ